MNLLKKVEKYMPNMELYDLIPGVGFFTNLPRIWKYDDETEKIRNGESNLNQNPELRDFTRLLLGITSATYHLYTSLSIAEYVGLLDKLKNTNF